MSALLLLGIGMIGGVGAFSRFLLDGAISSRAGSQFPYGTFAVNLAGAFLLGLVVGLAVSEDTLRLAGTGALGAFTTFSTWALESQRLAEDGQGRLGALNFAGSLAGGLLAVWLGRLLGSAL